MTDKRNALLKEFGDTVCRAAVAGHLGKPINITRVAAIKGPRAGAIEFRAGLDSGNLRRVLGRDDCAALRQFVPWRFIGRPQVFMDGRDVRVEAGWPKALADSMIPLSKCINIVGKRYANSGRWIAGMNEHGAIVMPQLCDSTPHFLVAGATGSGKSIALSCAVLQFSSEDAHQIVLVDGKRGRGLKRLEKLPGVIGPCAVEGPQIRNALGWAVSQMIKRQQNDYDGDGHIVVVVDEFQELTGDPVIADMLRKLVAQGRDTKVNVMMATQHPDLASFGDKTIRRNLNGKLALYVGDFDASKVAVGGSLPRADMLLGEGDSYAISPGNCHRVQGAFVDDADISAAESVGHTWVYTVWPEYEAESIAGGDGERGQFQFTGDELGVAVVSSVEGEGRGLFGTRMVDAGYSKPGYNRQKELRQKADGAVERLTQEGYSIYRRGKEPQGFVVAGDQW